MNPLVTEEIAHENNKGLGTLRKPDELFGGRGGGEKKKKTMAMSQQQQ
jgi:hypothetical protein